MEIRARRMLGVLYRCSCGAVRARLGVSQTRRNREYVLNCYKCHQPMEAVERRHYTVFASDLYETAGTLGKLGPFTVCTIVHPNIRVFRRWVRDRRAENAEKTRLYLERERNLQAQRALVAEAARIAYRHEHAAELAAEKIARAAWPAEVAPLLDDFSLDDSDEFP